MAKKAIMTVTGFFACYNKGKVELFATGEVNSGGWTDPELRLINHYVEFVANEPEGKGGVSHDIKEVAASLSLEVLPKPTDAKVFR